MLREGHNPFEGQWDPRLLINEIEEHIGTQVVDIDPVVKGSNNYVSQTARIFECYTENLIIA